MTPDQLRALADALRWVQYTADWQACDQAADYLRACAEQNPVARLLHWHGPRPAPRTVIVARTFDEYSVKEADDPKSYWKNGEPLYAHPAPAVPAGWKLVPVEPTPEMLSAVGMMDGYDWHAPGCSPDADHATWYSAMIAAAPAAPQAEPIDPHMIAAEDRFPDVPAERWKPCPQCGGDFDRECPICDGLGRVLATDGEQAEPKREPLSDERIAEIQRAAYERAAQVCIETAAELRRCADGCTDGRYDWKADGALDCADAISALGRQQ